MFVLHPILDTMIAFYELPRTPERFNRYLELLRGDTKGDLVLPIGVILNTQLKRKYQVVTSRPPRRSLR